ncbi:4bc6e789-11e0-485a-9012-88c740b4c52d [Thermothielavioides terrestris]|uniref:4bc6e789-11e0-485a-9012-88c740b4c52d n=1 Tax=Thermothielavioides terrestris TaxID=2587410 RepID=A0A3S4BPU8_9PEZI|nr:4bc6e789-11e0-485a-9012-88c740b4c52d [Thermothielavioides terrestris]
MAASRRGQPPLSVRLPPPSPVVPADLPPVSALFLIDFDVKAGYTIVWKRAAPGLELEGTVEYKSLPSGLHTVPDDLIYFVHDGGHAGLSAFVNTPTDEEETRHARMIAVGVLVPLSYGRLGRAWRHAEGLKEIAAQLAADRKQTQLLEDYWDKHGVRETTALQPLKDTPLESPVLSIKASRPGLGRGHARNRSASDGTALVPPGHRLSPFHPAWSLTSLLDTFGPLIFPIHRAALLRKRILISCHAPVHEVCNFVYDISVLSNIPLSVCDVIEPSAPVQRLRPLFTIGVHDISYLLEHQAALKRPARGDNPDGAGSIDDTGSGWVACTTDSILAMKEGLWDMLITMPPPYSANAKQRVWPTVECPKGVPPPLRSERLSRPDNPSHPPLQETRRLLPLGDSLRRRRRRPPAYRGLTIIHSSSSNRPESGDDTDAIVEPTTWAALAYNGFMWWASAGEKRHGDEVDEQSRDAALLADLAPPLSAESPVMGAPQQRRRRSSSFARGGTSGAGTVDELAGAAAGHDGAGDERGGEPAVDGSEHGGDDEEEQEERQEQEEEEEEAQARVELAVVAYFHRLTTSLLSVLADIVDSSDEDDLLDVDVDTGADFDGPAGLGQGAEDHRRRGGHPEEQARLLGAAGPAGGGSTSRGWVRVDSEALAAMGLDVWSQADAAFVRELSARYFSRRAHVETKA